MKDGSRTVTGTFIGAKLLGVILAVCALGLASVAVASARSESIAVPDTQAGDPLTGTRWQWTNSTLSDGSRVDVSNPENYTLDFVSAGALAIKADCNSVSATYVITGNQIAITLGPSTLVACPEGSLDSTFLRQLGEVGSYFMQDGDLIMELKFDSGSMRFDPLSQTPPTTPATEGLTGAVWRWFATELNNDTEVRPPDPESYTIEFLEGGQVAIQADCNQATGTYTADNGSMTITVGTSTLAFCGEDSLDQTFLRSLGEVAAYRVEATNLYLDLRADVGTMRFAYPQNGGEPGMPRTGVATTSGLQLFVLALFLAIVCLVSGALVYRSYHIRGREEAQQQVRVNVSRTPDGFSNGEAATEGDDEGSWR